LPEDHDFKIGDHVRVNGPWRPFTGVVIRIVQLTPIQLVIQRDDGEGIVAVRVRYCEHLPPAEAED
jgi:hypothetical protein